jgi:hypothetical protein
MTYSTRKAALKDELWNVSLLPTVKASSHITPPRSPEPSGGGALQAPALLSVSETVTPEPWPLAA